MFGVAKQQEERATLSAVEVWCLPSQLALAPNMERTAWADSATDFSDDRITAITKWLCRSKQFKHSFHGKSFHCCASPLIQPILYLYLPVLALPPKKPRMLNSQQDLSQLPFILFRPSSNMSNSPLSIHTPVTRNRARNLNSPLLIIPLSGVGIDIKLDIVRPKIQLLPLLAANLELAGTKGAEAVPLTGAGLSRIEGPVTGDVGGGGLGGDLPAVRGLGGRFAGAVLGVGLAAEVGLGRVGGVVEALGQGDDGAGDRLGMEAAGGRGRARGGHDHGGKLHSVAVEVMCGVLVGR